MTQYRMKPVVVEAMQFDGTTESAEACVAFAPGTEIVIPDNAPVLMVLTPSHGYATCRAGDWVVKDPVGGFAAIAGALFEATYEAIE